MTNPYDYSKILCNAPPEVFILPIDDQLRQAMLREGCLNAPYPKYICNSINLCDAQQASINSMINACCSDTEHFYANDCEYFVRSEPTVYKKPRFNREDIVIPSDPDEEDIIKTEEIPEPPVGFTIINCEEEKTDKQTTRSKFIFGVILGACMTVIIYLIKNGGFIL